MITMIRIALLLALVACTSSNSVSAESAPWTAIVGIERQTFDPGPLPGGRDAWLASGPRLVLAASGRIAVPFEADPASPTSLRLDGFFDTATGGSMFLFTEVATETMVVHGKGFDTVVRLSIEQDAASSEHLDGGASSALLGAASVLAYIAIPGEGPCEGGTPAHASQIDYHLVEETRGMSMGTFVTTDQTLRVGPIAVRFVVPDDYCDMFN
jgi:hypothetical protein